MHLSFFRISNFHLLIGGIVCLFLLTQSCDFSSSSSQENHEEVPDTTKSQQVEGLQQDSMQSTQRSRGLDMSTARTTTFSLKDYLPKLYALVEGDPALSQDLESYARAVIVRDGLESEEDLVAVFTQRDSQIIPFLEPLFENMEENTFYAEGKAYEEELNQIGLFIRTAEGMFIGLGQHPVLEVDIERLASEPYRLYLAFQQAYSEAMRGEYPYLDMEPYQRMITLGERLSELAPNPYFPKIEEDYFYALRSFTDVHLVKDPTAREGENGSPLVGGIHLDHYPYSTETKTISRFAESQTESSYGKVAKKIMENMSEISTKPENIYVIVTEWADDQEMAQQRVVSHLRAGEDIPHYLQIRRGDGKDRYAIAYRFYEDADKADAALEKILPAFPDAQMIYCSVKNQELYQLGPSAD